ncbi:MAG: hypothetical protein D6706_20155 [Chloroflexi bacterium]|nr:MAG: hypothetical protein D6706_20155 [Chloroflexota bacterium]
MADLVITAANVLASSSASVASGIAGATITAGQPLYKDSADAYALKPAQADAATTDEVVGVALHGAADGQPIQYVVSDSALNLGATLVAGQVYVLSAASAGGVAPISDLTSGNYVSVLGVATTTSTLKLHVINSGVAKP